jgi:tetratricopeptide (TPR) repeat protein
VGAASRRKRDRAEAAAPAPAAVPAATETVAPTRTPAPTWVVAGLLAALALAVYAQARSFDFVNYDDYHYVVENPHVATGLTARNLAWAFTAFHSANWHPLTWISHQIDCQIFGLEPGGHHVTNAVLHAANTALLFVALVALTGGFWRSAIVAALFAVHPLNVESVAWVAERKNVLSTLFWFLALRAYARRRPRTVFVLTLLALLAKPMAVTLPFTLLLVDWWPLGRWDPAAPDRWPRAVALVREKLPLVALSAASSLVTMAAQRQAGAVTSLEQVPIGPRAANAIVSYAAYLAKALWPARLAVFYPHPGVHVPVGAFVLSAVVLVAISAAAWRLRRSRPHLAVGWLWYLGTLVPVIGLVQVGAQAMADRYAYIPLIGIFVAVVWGLAVAGRRAAAGLDAAAIVALAVTAHAQAAHWTDSLALFEHARQVTRNNYVAYTNLGLVYNKQKRWETAIAHFREALRLQPRSADALGHMGLALARSGRIDEAVEALSAAIAIYPDSVHAHNNLGVALRTRDPERALTHLRRAVELDPEFAEARVNLASVLLDRGQTDEAQRALDAALALEPRDAATHFRVGSALLQHGRLDEAASHFETTLALDPTHVGARNSLGVVRLRKGDPKAALAFFRDVLEREPDDADARSNLGTALVRLGRTDEGLRELVRALELEPRQADAHATLGAVLARQGHLDEAVDHFHKAMEADPDNAVAHNNLGAALLQRGELAGAREQLERAVALAPGNADAQANLGALLLQEGELEAAVTHLQAALRSAPDHKNAQANLSVALARRSGH